MALIIYNIDKIIWLCQRFPGHSFGIRYHFALATIRCGPVEPLRWLASVGFRFGLQKFASRATAAGQLASLRYLVEEAGCPWDAAAVRKPAVSFDNPEVLQWAIDADAAAWTTAQLSELLAVAGQNDKLRAAEWLCAAGAERPTSFLYIHPYTMNAVWPLRAMQWARADGCPWGVWDYESCASTCSTSLSSNLEERQATQDAMLWAHAAGCPCDGQMHRIASKLTRKINSSSSSSSDGSSSSSSSSSSSRGNSRIDHVNGDVFGDVPAHSCSDTFLLALVPLNW